MSTVNSFDKSQHFAELNSPLFGVNPTPMTPAARKAAALTNLGALGSASVQSGLSGARFTQQPLMNESVNTLNATGTLTAAMILGGLVTSTTAAAVTGTTDTGTLIDTAALAIYPGLAVGDTFDVTIVNTGAANAFTLAGGTGVTIVGAAAVALSTSGSFRFRKTGVATYSVYRL